MHQKQDVMTVAISKPHHILVVGGGAGGLELVTRLGHKLGKYNKARITLVDEQTVHLWKPLLHEVAAGSLDSNIDQINYYAHSADSYYVFQPGRMIGLNREAKTIKLGPLANHHGEVVIPERSLSYDTLVLAVGSLSNDFNTPGVKEYCLSLDNLEQANEFQQKYLNELLCAQYGPDNRQEPFQVVIVGAGATGVELAAELHHTLRQASAYGLTRPTIQLAQISLIEAGPRILPPLPETVATAVFERLKSLGIRVYTQEQVTRVRKNGIETSSGNFYPADLSVWAAGVKAPDFLAQLGLETDKINRLIVNNKLQTTLDPNIFAIGDCAYVIDKATGMPVPPRAQAAHQQAEILVKSLQNKLENKPLMDFKYQDHGSLVALSCYDAFGSLTSFRKWQHSIGGKVARVMYRALYFLHLQALYGFWGAITIRRAKKLLTKRSPRLKLHFSKY
ncbi:NAD(P)/FAD-dependent oxidoreductase [Legionella jordanis]|nr:NAD(P)/FAD-dependent oxidoreductase [Legionella jordanis]